MEGGVWKETGCGGRGVGGDRVWREIEAVFVCVGKCQRGEREGVT